MNCQHRLLFVLKVPFIICFIWNLTDTSKKRMMIRKSMTRNSKLLETTVAKHNSVVEISTNQAPLELSDVTSGRFAWKNETGMIEVANSNR